MMLPSFQLQHHPHLGEAFHSLLEHVTITAHLSTSNQGVLWPRVANIPSWQL